MPDITIINSHCTDYVIYMHFIYFDHYRYIAALAVACCNVKLCKELYIVSCNYVLWLFWWIIHYIQYVNTKIICTHAHTYTIYNSYTQ